MSRRKKKNCKRRSKLTGKDSRDSNNRRKRSMVEQVPLPMMILSTKIMIKTMMMIIMVT